MPPVDPLAQRLRGARPCGDDDTVTQFTAPARRSSRSRAACDRWCRLGVLLSPNTRNPNPMALSTPPAGHLRPSISDSKCATRCGGQDTLARCSSTRANCLLTCPGRLNSRLSGSRRSKWPSAPGCTGSCLSPRQGGRRAHCTAVCSLPRRRTSGYSPAPFDFRRRTEIVTTSGSGGAAVSRIAAPGSAVAGRGEACASLRKFSVELLATSKSPRSPTAIYLGSLVRATSRAAARTGVRCMVKSMVDLTASPALVTIPVRSAPRIAHSSRSVRRSSSRAIAFSSPWGGVAER